MKYWKTFPALHRKLSKFDPNRLQGLSFISMIFAGLGAFLLVLGINGNTKLAISWGAALTGVFGGIALLLLVWDLAGRWLKGEPAPGNEKPYMIKGSHLVAGYFLVLIAGGASTGVVAHINGHAEISIFIIKAVLAAVAVWLALILAGRLSKEKPRESRYNFIGAMEFDAFNLMICGLFFSMVLHFAVLEMSKQSFTVRQIAWVTTMRMLFVTGTLTMCVIYLVCTAVELATRGRRKDKPAE